MDYNLLHILQVVLIVLLVSLKSFHILLTFSAIILKILKKDCNDSEVHWNIPLPIGQLYFPTKYFLITVLICQ